MTAPQPAADTPRAAALHYAQLGLRVVPIRPGGKAPAIRDWTNVATTSPEQIRRWWPDTATEGVGIVTGTAAWGQFFVLDIDNRPEYDGHDTLHDLEQAYDQLPDTWRAVTGSGGTHLYLRVPEGHPCPRNDQSGHLGPGLDIRGDGGQVLAAPTRHPVTGRPYAWDISPDDQPIADAPGWLLALLERDPPRRVERQAGQPTRDDRPGDKFNIATTWPQLLEADGATFLGTSHDPAGPGYERWRRPGKHDGDMSASVHYRGSDRLYNFSSNWPGLEADRSYDRFGYWVATRWHGDFTAAAHALTAAATADDVATLIGTPGQLTTAPQTPTQPPQRRSWFLDWSTFWDLEWAEEWAVPRFLARGYSHAVYAPAKTGKSLFTLWQLAHAVEHDPTIVVVYFDLEMTERDVQERLIDFGYGPDSDLARLRYAVLPPVAALDTPAGAADFLDAVDAELAAFPGLHPVVVIDTTARTITGDENDSSTYIAWARHTGVELKRRGITWVRVDHAGKDLERGQRGSSAKNDDLDIVWQITRIGEGIQVRATHRRMGWVPESTLWQQHDNPVRYSSATRHAVELLDVEQQRLSDLLDRLGVSPDAGRPAVLAALKGAGEVARQRDVKVVIRHRKAIRERSDEVVSLTSRPATSAATQPPEHAGRPADSETDQRRSEGTTTGQPPGDQHPPRRAGRWSPPKGDQPTSANRPADYEPLI